DDEEQRRHREADDYRGEHQRLRRRVGEGRGIDRGGRHDRLGPDTQAARRQQEHVDGVGEHREPDDHLEGPWPQHQPHAGGGYGADTEGGYQLHQSLPPASAGPAGPRLPWTTSCSSRELDTILGVRIDWCASAMSMRTVAPTTSTNTPRSKSVAEEMGMGPNSGTSAYS